MSLSQDTEWKLFQNIDGVRTWQHSCNKNITGTMDKRSMKKDRKKLKGKNLFKKLKNKRKEMLQFAGISNWQAHKYDWIPGKEYHQLQVDGSYMDVSGRKILFREIHVYTSDKIIQMLHTRPKSTRNGNSLAKEVMSFMKKQAHLK